MMTSFFALFGRIFLALILWWGSVLFGPVTTQGGEDIDESLPVKAPKRERIVTSIEARVLPAPELLEVRVAQSVPGGFLSHLRRTNGEEFAESIYVGGWQKSSFEQGQWWRGKAQKIGRFQPWNQKMIYTQYQAVLEPVSQEFSWKAPEEPSATVTYHELQALAKELSLSDFLEKTEGLSQSIPQGAVGGMTADQWIALGLKQDQIDYLEKVKPQWDQVAATAQKWLEDRPMPISFQSWLKLLIQANNEFSPESVGSMRNTVQQLLTQMVALQAVFGEEPVGYR